MTTGNTDLRPLRHVAEVSNVRIHKHEIPRNNGWCLTDKKKTWNRDKTQRMIPLTDKKKTWNSAKRRG